MEGPLPPLDPYAPPKEEEGTVMGPGGAYFDLASRWRRLAGAVIDGVLIALAGAPAALVRTGRFHIGISVGTPVFRPWDTSAPGLASTLLFAILVAVQSYLIARSGQSLGKRALEMRIVRLDGSAPSFLQAVVIRTWVPLVLPLVPLVGGLLAIADVLCIFGPSRRCLHDQAAGTRVILLDPPGL